MPRTEHVPELIASSARPGGPITLMQGAEMIVVDADVLRTILAEHDPAPEPCEAEIHSWSYFSSEAVDSYWMRCDRLGPHDEHENSETGAHWGRPDT